MYIEAHKQYSRTQVWFNRSNCVCIFFASLIFIWRQSLTHPMKHCT